MKIFIIIMFDEYNEVLKTIQNIRKLENTYIILFRSVNTTDFNIKSIIDLVDLYIQDIDLSKLYQRYVFPSYAISRNYSLSFKTMYNFFKVPEYIVAITGDTLIEDAFVFDRLNNKMNAENKVAGVIQAVGQDFHSDSSNPAAGVCGGRFQNDDTTDFSCSLFMINGSFAFSNRVFEKIAITNKYTTEQILGDELLNHIDKNEFKNKVMRINSENPKYMYSFKEGIRYHTGDQEERY